MKVAIVGSRGLVVDNIGDYLPDGTDCIVSGGAKGIDTCAAEYAKSHNLRLIEFLPDYKKHGRRAPIIRNADIVNECDYLLAFWDGKSRGTKNSIDNAKKQHKPTKVYIMKQTTDNISFVSRLKNLF